ncbi:phosphatidylinositol glycan class P family protein [Babesia bovis T2Bo]|uniref:phosphatidylinositol glycan class P family protein n=1 Tax=Babesia bovis T2Bo TaxID=484906 RepID=UPI001C368D8F|nr:phosphatidylinositol glycan class P family protein [Babesia bovis T2Bo]KAG6440026.1 phosphatidylinositol glycan class P family protein [Babesia bovis T2Bo]
MDIEIKAYITLVLIHLGVGLYFLWALTPERVINAYGITYYPSKHWAVALPASLIIIGLTAAFYSYFSERSMLPPLNSRTAFVDPVVQLESEVQKRKPLYDIPLEVVNQKLYQ